MKRIKLTQNKIVLIDNEDFELVVQYKWYYNNNGYAVTSINNKKIYMHRLILNIRDTNILVDHKNRNGIDNRKKNLRIATKSENVINSKLPKNNTSGYKGVSYVPHTSDGYKRKKPWAVHITKDKKRYFLGYHSTKENANIAYTNACIKLFGEFSNQ